MAAISVTQMWSKEGGSGESEKYDSFATRFSHTEGYMVEAEPGDSAEDVLSATGLSMVDIPDYGERHRSGADSFVKTKEAQPLGPIFWVVTVTNSDTFLGWPPGTAKLIGISAKNQFKWGMPLEQWDVTARIQFRIPYMGATAAQAWYKRWRHEGLYINAAIDPDTSVEIRRATDIHGQELTKPILLKANGEQEGNPDYALFVYTQLYGSLPYSALGLI
jgi:hypothetical protein